MDDIVSYVIGKKKGGVTPTGEIDITQNGITNVSGYATANVQVPEPSGTINITQNGETNVKNYETANVNVPQPSGKISITQNGTDIDVSSYASADVNVPAGADLSEYFNTTLTGGVDNWKIIQKKYPDISISGTSMSNMFKGYNLPIQPPKISDTSNIKNFLECYGSITTLTTIDAVKYFDISNATDMRYMFQSCTNLKTLDLSNWVNTKSIQTNNMFEYCSSLEELDMSNFDFTTTWSTNAMFRNVPANCLIYVKNQTQVDWFTTNFPSLTNVQIKS